MSRGALGARQVTQDHGKAEHSCQHIHPPACPSNKHTRKSFTLPSSGVKLEQSLPFSVPFYQKNTLSFLLIDIRVNLYFYSVQMKLKSTGHSI